MSTATLYLPRLRMDQYKIATHPAKVKVLAMGRRWGKTVMSGVIAMTAASMGGRVAWTVPVYKNGRSLWRWAEATAAPLRRYGVTLNRADRIIEFPNGGGLSIYSADSGDSMRSEAFHLVIVDEAARVAQDVYTDVIQPTLADYDGDLILISSPFGKNWFYHEYVAALGDKQRMAAWNAPTSDNPNPNIKRAFELARNRVPERTYRAEWLAEFVEDGGEVFRNVRACAKGELHPQPIPGHTYLIAVDLGKVNDFTVLTVFDMTINAVVFIDRFNQIDYTVQLSRLKVLYERYNARFAIIERNIGEMFIEQARRAGLSIRDFFTSAQSKQKLIDDLSVAFEQGVITILHDRATPDATVMITELEAYTLERMPSGNIRYNAPVGSHDDTVISLALAWHGAANQEIIRRGSAPAGLVEHFGG